MADEEAIGLALKLSSDDLDRDVAAAQSKLDRLGKADTKIKVHLDTTDAEKRIEHLKDVINGIGQGIGQAGIGLVGNAVQSAGSLVATTTLQFEKFNTVLKTLYGDTGKADAAFQGIQKFAQETPFQLDEVLGSFIKLKNRGFDPTNESLTKLGDLASSQGKKLDQVTEALLDAQQGEFERLKEFGISANTVGDKVTFTFKGVTQTVAKTPEAISAAILKMGELKGVAGGMEAQSKTLGGQLSNLQDAAAKVANSFGKELTPVLTELVKGFLSGSGNAEQFAKELGQNTATLIKLLSDTLKVAADNSTLLGTVLEVLILRFTVLRAIALAETLKATATALFTVATQATSAGLALNATATGALAATGPLIVLVAAVAAANFIKQGQDLRVFNQGLEGVSNGADAAGDSAILLANKTKNLNTAFKENGKFTDEQKEKAKQLLAINAQQLTVLNQQLDQAKALKPANEDQANAQTALVGGLEVSIRALKGQTDALEKNLQGTKANATAKKTLKDKIDDINDATTKQLAQATAAESKSLAEIADAEGTAGNNKAALEARKLESTQARINSELTAERDRLEKLQALPASKDDKEEKERLKAIADSNQKIDQLDLQSAQNRSQQRQQAEQAALEKIVAANEDANQAITHSQNARLANQKHLLLTGQIDEEQYALAAAKIAESTAKQEFQAKRRELEEVEKARKSGTISTETALKQEKTLNAEIGKANLARIDAELQAQKALRAERVASLRSAGADQRAPIEQASNTLERRDTSLKQSDDLLSARLRTTNALASLEQNRLQYAIDTAKEVGNTVLAAQLQQQLFASQTAQLAEQQRVRAEITKSENEQKLNQAEIAVNQAAINVLVAQEAVATAELEGRSTAEIARLEKKVSLAGEILAQTKKSVAFQQQINVETDKAITAEDKEAREKLANQQQQAQKQKETHTQKVAQTKEEVKVDKAAIEEVQRSREKGIDRQLQLEFASNDKERERLQKQFGLEDQKVARRKQLEAPFKAQDEAEVRSKAFNTSGGVTQGSGQDFGPATPAAKIDQAGSTVQSKGSAPPVQAGFDTSINRLAVVFKEEIGGLKTTLVALLNSPRSLTVSAPAPVQSAGRVWRDITNNQVGAPGGL